ncbi:hypothetical protein DFJ73DRAFT_795203 [Zopfochytrium polystomum]|nr:hypothetical protein DFJ73DRAFT_795203 [Zopfochytrium polystomum]
MSPDRFLLEQFDAVIDQFLRLDKPYRDVITDITRRMGAGMAEFCEPGLSVESMDDYNLYTHYVAGLVGLGLTGLFVATGLESHPLLQVAPQRGSRAFDLPNNMGFNNPVIARWIHAHDLRTANGVLVTRPRSAGPHRSLAGRAESAANAAIIVVVLLALLAAVVAAVAAAAWAVASVVGAGPGQHLGWTVPPAVGEAWVWVGEWARGGGVAARSG